MKKFLVTTGLLLSLFTGFSQPAGFLSVKGREVVSPGGQPFRMKGTNLGNWLVPEGYMFKFANAASPRLIQEVLLELVGPDAAGAFWKTYLENYITRGDIHYLRSIGVNSIRIPFHYKLFTDEDYLGGRGEARGFALMDKVVGWCKDEGLYAILDMHCAPGGQTGDNIDDSFGYPFLFESPESQELAARIWKRIAAHYKNETTVLGYDLLNEPIPHFFDTGHLNPMLEPLYRKLVSAVREADTNHIVILGGAQWDSNFDVFGKPFDAKAVYTFHKYWTPPTVEVIRTYLDFSRNYEVPLYCGETGENTDDWVRDFRKVLDSAGVGWHFWPYKKMDNARGIASFMVPDGYDQVIRYADSSRSTFDQVRKQLPKDREVVKKALKGFLENCRFERCFGNKGYIEALGFTNK
jgi:endoglucanase